MARPASWPATHRTAAARPVVLELPARLDSSDARAWCEHVRSLFERAGPAGVICDVAGVGEGDLDAIGVLASVVLVARQERRPLRLRNPSPALVELLDLTGLGTALLTPIGVWNARATR